MTSRLSRDFWQDCSERETLFGIFSELHQPIVGLKGYAQLLKMDITLEKKQKAVEEIGIIFEV